MAGVHSGRSVALGWILEQSSQQGTILLPPLPPQRLSLSGDFVVGRECFQHVEPEAVLNILQAQDTPSPKESVIRSKVSGVPLRNPGGGAH